MEQLISYLKTMPEYTQLLNAISRMEPAAVTGLGQINRSHMVAALCSDQPNPVIIICQDDVTARRIQEEVKAFCDLTAPILPSRELTLYDTAVVSR
jgi:transcription-repair coupling factor (superfamily II helicase)